MPENKIGDEQSRILRCWWMFELFSPQKMPKSKVVEKKNKKAGKQYVDIFYQAIEWGPGDDLPWDMRSGLRVPTEYEGEKNGNIAFTSVFTPWGRHTSGFIAFLRMMLMRMKHNLLRRARARRLLSTTKGKLFLKLQYYPQLYGELVASAILVPTIPHGQKVLTTRRQASLRDSMA